MKKILFSMLGAGLILTSCSSDEPFATGEGGEKQVTFTLNVPDAVGTRAGEQSSSDKGGVSNTNSALNYTIALYYGGELEWSAKAAGEGTSVTFTPTVILGRNYQVVAYADFKGTKYDLKAISIVNGINDESKDAYFVSQPAQFTETDLTEDITLKRPFGKLRLVATDYDENKTAVKDVTVTYTNGAHFKQFNAFSGVFAETVDESNVYTDEEYDVAYTESEGEKTIFVDYIPVNSDGMFPFQITVTYAKGTESFTRTFAQDIPVKRNALTTLKGNFFTANATINVTVVEDFDSEINENGELLISTVDDLKKFATRVNAGETFSKQVVKLTSDLDLNNENWTPIGNSENKFMGTFDGQNYTISNLKVELEDYYIGLFGYTQGGAIKNLNIENADIKGTSYVAVVAGCAYTTPTSNITIKGDIKVEATGQDVGALTGYTYGNITDVTVEANEGSYVKASSYFGGVVGYPGEGNTTFTRVKSNIDVIGKTYMIGGITGIAQYGNKFIDCSCSGDVSLTEGDPESNNRWLRVGGIAGSWMDGAGNVVTLENCEYTGTLSSRKTNGVVATEFDNEGLVGRGYNYNGEGTLIINGKNMAVESFKAALVKGGEVKLTQNLELTETVTIPAGVETVLDLNGKSLTANSSTYAINNLGTLTIKDVAGNGSINARGIYNGYDATGNNVTEAKIIVEGGQFNATGENGGAAIFNYGVVEINDGTFTSIGGYSLNNQSTGNMTINKAVVTGGIYNLAKLEINDGEIATTRGGSTHAIYSSGTSLVVNGGEFEGNGNEVINSNDTPTTINGGTFEKVGKASYLLGGNKMVINDGTFNAFAENPAENPIRPSITVYGGTFNYEPKNLPAGYVAQDNGDGTWTVVAE